MINCIFELDGGGSPFIDKKNDLKCSYSQLSTLWSLLNLCPQQLSQSCFGGDQALHYWENAKFNLKSIYNFIEFMNDKLAILVLRDFDTMAQVMSKMTSGIHHYKSVNSLKLMKN